MRGGVIGPSQASVSAWHVDWPRLARRAVILCSAVAALIQLYRNAQLAKYGFDFHGGAWQAGQDVLSGRSPYPAPNSWYLVVHGNAFIPPPLLALVSIPFSLLPYGLAVAIWNLVCTGALAAALRLIGVRDRRLYLLALCSWPFVISLIMGQPDGLFALAAAATWRYRGSWRGAAACGGLIAAKLLALPLLLWLLATRRFRMAGVAAASAIGLLAASWACIGFKGLASYPQLLRADARAFESRSHSVVAAAMRLGASETLARSLAILFALVIALAVVRAARRSDAGCFAAALLVGVLASPILWSHYLVLLFVPIAICRPNVDRVWLLTALFYLSPIEPPPSDIQVIFVLLTAAALLIWASSTSERVAIRDLSASAVRSAHPPAVGHSTFV
jgi:hypothetical protein